jgi:hypothetical protein
MSVQFLRDVEIPGLGDCSTRGVEKYTRLHIGWCVVKQIKWRKEWQKNRGLAFGKAN